MTKNELIIKVAAALTTLNETDGAPESMLYIGLCDSIQEWEILRQLLIKCDLVTIQNHYVTLTKHGKETVATFNSLKE